MTGGKLSACLSWELNRTETERSAPRSPRSGSHSGVWPVQFPSQASDFLGGSLRDFSGKRRGQTEPVRSALKARSLPPV